MTESFYQAFRGTFHGVLRWDQLDALWAAVRRRAGAGWYVYRIGEPPPHQPLAADGVNAAVDDIDTVLRREHPEDYCGIVYADDLESPTFIKIFDPHNLGVVCGYSDNPPLPGWVLSTIKPADLEQLPAKKPAQKSWWRRLFG